jgi:hypothetical protein
MVIQMGDLVKAISLVDGTMRSGIVTGFLVDGVVQVQMSSFHTLCKDPQRVNLSDFDPLQRWWLNGKREELLREQQQREKQLPLVIHYE